MITAHGKTYETVEQAQERITYLRNANSVFGASDGRVTEILLIERAIAEAAAQPVREAGCTCTIDGTYWPAQRREEPLCPLHGRAASTEPAEPVFEVVKDSYEIPCDHPACAILHRHLAKEPFWDGGYHWVDVYHNGKDSRVRTNRWHNLTREGWVILRNGERVGDFHGTKREALAEAATKPTH